VISAPRELIEDACASAWTIMVRRDDITLDPRGFSWLTTVVIRPLCADHVGLRNRRTHPRIRTMPDAIVGVVVGFALGIARDVTVGIFRLRRDSRERRRAMWITAYRALAELEKAAELLDDALEANEPWPSDTELPTGTWDAPENKLSFAETLSPEQWRAASLAFTSLRHLNRRRQRSLHSKEPDIARNPDVLAPARSDVRAAEEVLRGLRPSGLAS
jgi:hypothetical protein